MALNRNGPWCKHNQIVKRKETFNLHRYSFEFWLNDFHFRSNAFFLCLSSPLSPLCLESTFKISWSHWCRGLIRAWKLAILLFALPLRARRTFFSESYIQGLMERVTAPPLTSHLKHEMKSRLEAGIYGGSEKRCSAASLFLTTSGM